MSGPAPSAALSVQRCGDDSARDAPAQRQEALPEENEEEEATAQTFVQRTAEEEEMAE
jgi:hypothetical protein